MIYHIYWGTAGNAGLYLDEIYHVLKDAGYEQKAFVSYYYPFNYGEKVFFKRTEMEHCRFNGIIRKVFQAYELITGLSKVILQSLQDKPDVINYSYAGWGNVFIYYFIKILRKGNKGKLIITCHDVVPSMRNPKDYDNEVKMKGKVYDLADGFIVHNDNSIEDLNRLYKIGREKCYIHTFPLMDLSKLDKDNTVTYIKYDYLFIGHLRKEKGFDFLFETWLDYHKINPEATLCVAGNAASFKEYIEERREVCKENNIELQLGFVKDEDYIDIVKKSACVVFPYLSGTNSGVISTVISLNRNVITSDIGMFANNPLVPHDCMFKAGDKKSFMDLLISNYHRNPNDNSQERIKQYRAEFNKQVRNVYSELLK